MSFPCARYWFVVLCAGCAQLAGFEDFHGAVDGGDGGANDATGGVAIPGGGGSVASGGGARSGNSGGPGAGGAADGGDPGQPDAGDTSFGNAGDGGASVNGGAANGGVAETGGSANGGGGNAGPSSGGNSTAGGGSTTGGVAAGGTASGGSSAGGSATGGQASDHCGQLLVNPTFASGTDGWAETSTYPDFVNNLHPIIAAGSDAELAAAGVAPQSDDYLLWLGGVPDSIRTHLVTAAQVVPLSPKLEELQFSGFARIETSESENEMYDNVYIELRAMDDDESLVWQFIARDNRDATNGWVELDPSLPDHSDIVRFRGQTVTFMAYSRTDAENPTHFWLDSLSLRALCDP